MRLGPGSLYARKFGSSLSANTRPRGAWLACRKRSWHTVVVFGVNRYIKSFSAVIGVTLTGVDTQSCRMNKLQRAGRDFLMRLVAEHGLEARRGYCGRWRMSWTI